MEEVLKAFPKAYVKRLGVLKYEIRRPRTKSDTSALVSYVVLSGVWSSEKSAWDHAKIRLGCAEISAQKGSQ